MEERKFTEISKCLYFLSIFIEGKRYQNAALEADAETKEVFRQIFPNVCFLSNRNARSTTTLS